MNALLLSLSPKLLELEALPISPYHTAHIYFLAKKY